MLYVLLLEKVGHITTNKGLTNSIFVRKAYKITGVKRNYKRVCAIEVIWRNEETVYRLLVENVPDIDKIHTKIRTEEIITVISKTTWLRSNENEEVAIRNADEDDGHVAFGTGGLLLRICSKGAKGHFEAI